MINLDTRQNQKKNFPEFSGIFRDFPEFSLIFRDFPEFSGIFPLRVLARDLEVDESMGIEVNGQFSSQF